MDSIVYKLHIYLAMCVLNCDWRKTRLVPDRPEHNYCLSRGEAVTGDGENGVTRIFMIYTCVIRMIKSSGLVWARHVARMAEKRSAYRVFFFCGNTKGTDNLQYLEVDGQVILKWALINRWESVDRSGLV